MTSTKPKPGPFALRDKSRSLYTMCPLSDLQTPHFLVHDVSHDVSITITLLNNLHVSFLCFRLSRCCLEVKSNPRATDTDTSTAFGARQLHRMITYYQSKAWKSAAKSTALIGRYNNQTDPYRGGPPQTIMLLSFVVFVQNVASK